jgi:hypothetical protein
MSEQAAPISEHAAAMSEQAAWQLSNDSAVAYERDFVPAIFAQWPPKLADIAGIAPGERVLGCAGARSRRPRGLGGPRDRARSE